MNYWINASWVIALLISTVTNSLIFVSTAFLLEKVTKKLLISNSSFSLINGFNFKKDQRIKEIKYGLIACLIFAGGSLFVRELFTNVFPQSFYELIIQSFSFVLFYETYSYFIHRLLHTKYFIRIHAIHHSSVRVTPWSAYCVHPVEAFFIGLSAGLFMLFFDLSLIIALVFHVFGMMFTIFIHSNITMNSSKSILTKIFSYPQYHAKHHKKSRVNFGFINQVWDKIFKTNA